MISTAWMESVYWREPLWLLLVLQPFLLLAIRRLSNKRKLSRYADPDLQVWTRWQDPGKPSSWIFSRHTLYLASWLLLAISMAGPRLLLEQPASADTPDMNIMIVVDVSRSMRARDTEQGRLQRAKIEINELIQSAANSRIGIILYTSRAHLLLPFTHDFNALQYYINFIDSIPLPTYGSEASGALTLAREEIKAASFESTSAVLWLTDGDISSNKNDSLLQVRAAINDLKKASIPLYILGVGSPEGDAIPDDESGWLQHEGRPVISRMDETLLADLASAGQGRFIIAQNDDSDWQYLYRQGMAAGSDTVGDKISNDETIWQELYPWFLFPAIIMLFICLMPYHLFTVSSPKVLVPICLLIHACLLHTDEASAESSASDHSAELANTAYQSYDAEQFNQAADLYRQISGFHGRLGEGNSYYRLADYPQAITQFNRAVMLANNDLQRGSAIYNLANATFMTGDYALAAVLYRDSLLYRPSHEASMANLNISLSLQQLIEDQIQQGLAGRMGTGPRTARAEQGLDINNQGAMAFDNEEERKNAELLLPDIPPQELSKLLARGLAHVRLAQDGSSPSGLTADRQSQWHQEIAAARLRMRELEDLQALLWKRLFEMEEGFPAPLEEAEIVPGILPW
ncbi:MAG: VWA domain-containing protein [Pseudomonadota bacterium]|nr:VWA domain-containing protein [Pseudomonadota bacterium]